MKRILTVIAVVMMLFAACNKENITPSNSDNPTTEDSLPNIEDSIPNIEDSIPVIEPTSTEQVLDSLLHYMFGPNLDGYDGHIEGDNNYYSFHYIANNLSDLQQTGFTLDPGINFDSCTLLYGMITTSTCDNILDSIELVYNDSTSTYNCIFHIRETFLQAIGHICYWRIYPKIDGEVEYFYDYHYFK